MTTTIELLQTQKNPTEKLGLYIHIPFCKKKCRYCDFFSIPVNNGVPDEYIHALLAELGDLPYKHTLKSIYIGGGTPSLLNIKQIEKIARHVNKLFKSDKPEFSIEVNPDDITEDWVKELKGVSINRISIGVQSFFDTELQ
ncbi:MAG TPA: radical SAM protein, partial [Candidatus Hydrogenedens sp.]|nr:radical SAM protein [Candidatus Hydrogenedens sp.]